MSAVDDLRGAAKLLRERAEAATQGPWAAQFADRPDDAVDWRVIGVRESGLCPIPLRSTTIDAGAHSQAEADVTYAASLHPLVGLALARAFEARCVVYEIRPPEKRESFAGADSLLAVARLYLGRSE